MVVPALAAGSPASQRSRMARREQALLGGATAALVLLRLLLVPFRTGPVLFADETGYAMAARGLAGGAGGQLSTTSFFHGGYSLLIAPGYAAFANPTTAYRAALVLGALLAASVLPLNYLLVRRTTTASPGLALSAGAVGASFPTLWVFSQTTTAEVLLSPLLLVALLLLDGLLAATTRARQALLGALLGVVVAASVAVHGRMLVAAGVLVLGTCVLLARRRLGPRSALAVLAALAGGLVLVRLLDAAVLALGYPDRQPASVVTALQVLGTPAGSRHAMGNLLGQGWYPLVATFGLLPLSLPLLLDRGAPLRRRAPVVALATLTVGLLIAGAIYLDVRSRPDQLVYGRYAEVGLPILAALGLVAVVQRPPTARRAVGTAVVVLAATGCIAVVRQASAIPGTASRWNVAALPSPTANLGASRLVLAGLVATVGVVVLARLARLARRRTAYLTVGLLLVQLAIGGYAVRQTSYEGQRATYPPGWTSPQAAVAMHPELRVLYDVDAPDPYGLYVLQHFLPESQLGLIHGDTELPTGALVLSTGDWASRRAPRAVLLWRDVGRDLALWLAPAR